MLGPGILVLSLLTRRLRDDGVYETGESRFGLLELVPWFILGFLGLAGLRSAGFVPDAFVGPLTKSASMLTVVSMAALGVGVDVRVIGRVGGRVTAAVTLSLMLLLLLSMGLIHFLKLH